MEIRSLTISFSKSKEIFFVVSENRNKDVDKNNLMLLFGTIFPPLQSMKYYESIRQTEIGAQIKLRRERKTGNVQSKIPLDKK